MDPISLFLLAGAGLGIIDGLVRGGGEQRKSEYTPPSTPSPSTTPVRAQPERETLRTCFGNVQVEYQSRTDGTYAVKLLSRPINANTSKIEDIHLLTDSTICTTKSIQSLERAKSLARYWVNGYEHCMKTGDFPDNGGTVRT